MSTPDGTVAARDDRSLTPEGDTFGTKSGSVRSSGMSNDKRGTTVQDDSTQNPDMPFRDGGYFATDSYGADLGVDATNTLGPINYDESLDADSRKDDNSDVMAESGDRSVMSRI